MLSFFEIFAWLSKFLLLKCCTKLHPFLNLICLNFYLQPKISHLSQNKLAKRAKQWRDQQWNWFSNWFVNSHNAKQALIYWCSVNLWLIYQARHCMEGKNQREVSVWAAAHFHWGPTQPSAWAHQALQKHSLGLPSQPSVANSSH